MRPSGRLRSLAVLELVNIPLWGFVLVSLFPASVANLAGFAAFAMLLAQGSAYWWLKLRQVRRRESFPAGLDGFASLRRWNPWWLAVVVAVCGGLTVAAPGAGTLPGLGLALFAVVEHVNYFHVQLSYDNRADLARLGRHGLRPAHLARDLRRWRRAWRAG
ncbi:hypothetical protein LX16_4679 [Stackebrandtia albiflava]|uniref:Uncharacterized protein n=1 Tax=Stackebrandtia albiflava TaxID=406432 RepID=A0A562UQL9_9ACTN|nr:hypothetical protein [Stackebrandtia albiflava]TWJ07897.1 hypothetical protein LX16_4679 [Stackebrandtia albiflava]